MFSPFFHTLSLVVIRVSPPPPLTASLAQHTYNLDRRGGVAAVLVGLDGHCSWRPRSAPAALSRVVRCVAAWPLLGGAEIGNTPAADGKKEGVDKRMSMRGLTWSRELPESETAIPPGKAARVMLNGMQGQDSEPFLCERGEEERKRTAALGWVPRRVAEKGQPDWEFRFEGESFWSPQAQ